MKDNHPAADGFPWAAVVALAVLSFALVKACEYCSDPAPPPTLPEYQADPGPAKPAPAKSREAKIKEQFSAWDGAHKGLEAWVKRNMNDPDSYEHVETSCLDNGETITVILKFRGANAFGGKVVNVARCDFDMDGNMIGQPSII